MMAHSTQHNINIAYREELTANVSWFSSERIIFAKPNEVRMMKVSIQMSSKTNTLE
jgi:hypothetical protein